MGSLLAVLTHTDNVQTRPVMWMFVGMLAAFLVARSITRYIRWTSSRHGSKSSGVINDIVIGGVHIHHQVFGIVLMFVSGVIMLSTPLYGSTLHATAALFGIGVGLTFDEFALWIHLEDVYWSHDGRKSIDAFFCVLGVTGILVFGSDLIVGPFGSLSWWVTAGFLLFALGLSGIALLKGKIVTGIMGIVALPIALACATRLAKPESWWATRHYAKKPSKQARSRDRFGEAYEARWNRVRDIIAGAPTKAH